MHNQQHNFNILQTNSWKIDFVRAGGVGDVQQHPNVVSSSSAMPGTKCLDTDDTDPTETMGLSNTGYWGLNGCCIGLQKHEDEDLPVTVSGSLLVHQTAQDGGVYRSASSSIGTSRSRTISSTLSLNSSDCLSQSLAEQVIEFRDQNSLNLVLGRTGYEIDNRNFQSSASGDRSPNSRVPIVSAVIHWKGPLKPLPAANPIYSRKVFLGGLPMRMTEFGIFEVFRDIGAIALEWPGTHVDRVNKWIGYAYVIFDSPAQVDKLVREKCQRMDNKLYVRMPSRSRFSKAVQVIPWDTRNNQFVKPECLGQRAEYKTFVGGLHGKFTAGSLAKIMNQLFDGVVCASLDADKYGYPIGIGRVGFNNQESYFRALTTNYVSVKADDVQRVIQVEPYVEINQTCAVCVEQIGPYFCKDLGCLKYFCWNCFRTYHLSREMNLASHVPKFKGKSIVQKELGEALISSLMLESKHQF